MKRKINFLTSLITTLFLVACGNTAEDSDATTSENTDSSNEGTTEIVLWHSMGGAIGETFDDLVAGYNESQDEVYVEAIYQGGYDETVTKLSSSAAGSDVSADIVQISEQGAQMVADMGITVPVQDYIERDDYDMSAFEENILAYYTLDGSLHSMPFNSSTPILYYNVDLFEEAGIEEIPTTLEEIAAITPQLQEAGATMGVSLQTNGAWVDQFMNKIEADIFNNGNGREGRATETVFVDNGGIEKVYSGWKAAEEAGAAPNIGREGGIPEFVSGDAAMTINSTAGLGLILEQVDGRFEVGTAYYPGIDNEDEGGIAIGGASMYMIDTEDEEKMDSAWDFIQYMVSPEVQANWSVNTGYFPVTMEAHDVDVFQANLEEYPQFQTAIDQLHEISPDDQGHMSGANVEIREILVSELEFVLNDEKDAATAAQDAATRSDEALSIYNRQIGYEE
jgi:sn-glycerol 3-phosphate transport system substrate-binding protein